MTSENRFKIIDKLEKSNIPITYRLSQKYIWIIFDENVLKEEIVKYKKNRIGSLDLNPNYIAFTIQDFDKNKSTIIKRFIFNLNALNVLQNNKIKHEVLEVSKRISLLAKHYQCEIIGFEKLEITNKDHIKGKGFNRLINNKWKKKLIIKNLIKRLNILGIRYLDIVPNYSSFVGCLDNPNETDSIAAALEIGRRAFICNKRFIEKNKEFLDKDIIFPVMDKDLIKERWNSILLNYNPSNMGYKGIYNYLKENSFSDLKRLQVIILILGVV